MDGDDRPTQIGEDYKGAEAADFEADETAVGVVEEAAEDKAKEIKIKVNIIFN